MNTLIHARKLTRRYGDQVLALDQVDLTIHQGEWLAMMGPSGSGKTTLLNLLGCLDQPTDGEIWFEGKLTTALDRTELTRFRRENVGFVFQQFHLVDYLTALENVMVAQYYHSMVDEEEAKRALTEVGLSERLHHYPCQLSGGEQQRACIARALINRPKLILADEPTGNLDEKSEEVVLDLFRSLHREGHTILMVTHDITVGKMADRQIQLEHGKIIGSYLTSLQAEEDIENLLKKLWELKEEGKLSYQYLENADFLDHAGTLKYMGIKGLLEFSPGKVALTDEGERRMKDVIRRHRLAEILFSQTLRMDKDRSDKEACQFEHLLDPEMTEKICSFLEHPKFCPHGRLIPPGECCKK
ncbi:MAG: ATP-binding cassette domain-containing protein [Chlamydiae bacterium]|nr:ATP-binding cassette domain-containing protein [Chlamydiota bacterium]MBI3277589.1 ATP-binding cassette domain-containing protein [Chlamydiota bacterium]